MSESKVLEELKRENLYLKEVQKQYRNYRNTVRNMLMTGELQLVKTGKEAKNHENAWHNFSYLVRWHG